MKKFLALVLMSLSLTACSSQPVDYKTYLETRNVGLSADGNIRHCHGYGCKFVTNVPLDKKDWKIISAAFRPRAKAAEQERKQIAKAIGLFEKQVGPKDGTVEDIRGTFRKTGDKQLDCVDESTNTTSYLSVLQDVGLLKFHTVMGPTMRFPIIHAGNWPHQTALIRDNKTGTVYAVDSWFRDNGAPADIIELKEWKRGWKPPDVHDLL